MERIKEPLVKIILLDTNDFITAEVEKILKDYPCEIKKISKLSEVNEACDYFIFYDNILNNETTEEIIKLPEYVKHKILVYNKDSKILGKLILELSFRINVEELDFMLRGIISEYIEDNFGPAYSETMQMITKFVNEAVHDIKLFLSYLESIKNNFKEESNDQIKFIEKFESSLKSFEKGLIYFKNFVFTTRVPLSYEDVNILVQSVLREREEDLKKKTKKLVYLPDYTLPMINTNSVVLKKVIDNLIEIILLSAKEVQSIEVSTKSQKDILVITFDVECSDFDKTLCSQIYNPLFPDNVLDNSLIDYFRTNIEEFLKISVHNYFDNNKFTFLIKIEMGE